MYRLRFSKVNMLLFLSMSNPLPDRRRPFAAKKGHPPWGALINLKEEVLS